jgi:hypothetical protein
MKIAVWLQIAVASVWLLAYLGVCIAYRLRWDARIRGAMGRRLGVDVRWRWIGDAGTRPDWEWAGDGKGPLGRTLWQMLVIATAQFATAALLGAAPALGLLWLEVSLDFHALVVLASAFLVIPIASVFFFRRGAPVPA